MDACLSEVRHLQFISKGSVDLRYSKLHQFALLRYVQRWALTVSLMVSVIVKNLM